MNEAAFLDAIAEAPDDDLTRLAYADWLEENGDGDQLARAELIRVQCEADCLREWDPRRRLLLRRANAIVRKHGRAWLAPLRKKGLPWHWSFRRGFVEHVEAKAVFFGYEAEKLFQAAPLLRAVKFPEASNEIEELLESPLVARLTEIDLSSMCVCGDCPIDEDQRVLIASPLVAGLRVLRLRDDRVDDETAIALAASPHLANLRKLDLGWNLIRAAGMRALATSPHLTGLTDLDLSSNMLGQEGFRALAEGRWPALEVLRLGGCLMSGKALSLLASSPVLDPVRLLDLSGNPLSNTGALALAKSPHLGNLECLELGVRHEFRPETVGALKARFGKKLRFCL
jgi:uncharacterized protein (TIGR02996 family)